MNALTPKDYQNAIAVQDACNLSGVVHSLAEVLPRIRQDNPATHDINTHPITIMYVNKLCSLSGGGEPEAFSKAYSACRDRALTN